MRMEQVRCRYSSTRHRSRAGPPPAELDSLAGVARIPGLQRLLHFICRGGFEHHVAVSLSTCAEVLEEAFTTYLGFETYRHR